MNATPQKKPQALGKGLSALMGNNTLPASGGIAPRSMATPAAAAVVEQVGPSGEMIRALDVAQITAGKYQPRRHFNEEQLTELADSIEKHGVMQPIVVREVASQQFEIIAGERRWRASKLAGLATIPAIVRVLSDSDALELALIENIQREDLNPLEEADGYQRLIEEFNYTQDALSKVVGKSRSHIANLLRLLKLPEAVKKMIDDGQLSMGHARALLMADSPEEIAKRVVAEGLSVRQIEQLSRGEEVDAAIAKIERIQAQLNRMGNDNHAAPRSGGNSGPSRSNEKTEDVLQLENMLSDSLGLRVSINTRGGQAGDVVISYDSLSQLDDILRRLGGGI